MLILQEINKYWFTSLFSHWFVYFNNIRVNSNVPKYPHICKHKYTSMSIRKNVLTIEQLGVKDVTRRRRFETSTSRTRTRTRTFAPANRARRNYPFLQFANLYVIQIGARPPANAIIMTSWKLRWPVNVA